MRRLLLLLAALPVFAIDVKLVDVRRIWDRAPHNAFTDLIRYRGEWFCVFREGEKHVSGDGKLRVIVSKNKRDWESAALLESPDGDLRDAKISLAPSGELMLSGAIAYRDGSPVRHHSLSWFSRDGRMWSKPVIVADPNFWLWRVSWHKKLGLGAGYRTDGVNRAVRLYRTADGKKFESVVDDFQLPGFANETAIRFTKDGTAYCLMRRDRYRDSDGKSATAQLGVSRPPYRDWTWKDLGLQMGGPNMLLLDESRAIGVVRLHTGTTRTGIVELDLKQGTARELLALPSKGDSSYAGMVLDGGRLTISYYSSHEGKTSIYLAEADVNR